MKIVSQKRPLSQMKRKVLSLCILSIVTPLSIALTVNEDFTKAQTSLDWYMPKTGGGNQHNQACLTAGNNKNVAGVDGTTKAGSPPACDAITDRVGFGALRLTALDWYASSGIFSNTIFPSNEGIDLSFTTYTYGGNGADGMSFFLVDADAKLNFGASGGALGYSCASNNPGRGGGVSGGYLAIGIDEYGNYLNRLDATSTGFTTQVPNTVALRGAGSINLDALKTLYPLNHWDDQSVLEVCRTGQFFNKQTNRQETVLSYPLLGYKTLPKNTMPLYTKVNSRDEATPISFRLKLAPDGKLSLWVSYNGGVAQPVMLEHDVIKENGPIPKNFRFGFAASTGGQNNIHEVGCFKATPNNETGATSNTNLPDAEYTDGAQIYTALYNRLYWYGQMVAQSIVRKKDGGLAVEPVANWDAGCNLTGGDCSSTNKKNVPAQKESNRELLTYSAAKQMGVALRWNELDANHQKILNWGGKDGERHLNYLRGSRVDEVKQNGSDVPYFRKRIGMLGDSVNTSPVWVGPPNTIAYDTHWVDKRNSNSDFAENRGQRYADFKREHNSRVNMVYVGANDGYLHGFRSGAYDETGKRFMPSSAKPNDGREEFAYMPASVLARMQSTQNDNLTFSANAYAHNYFQDATPGVGDVFFENKWHTILVSGLGAGGASIFALDVTDPTGENNPRKEVNESRAKYSVIGEWSFSPDKTSIWNHLGNTYGTPQIGRFHNGQWGAVFGNGWCSKQDAANGNCSADVSGQAGIYVMLIDEKTRRPSFRFIGTNSGDANSPNGIAYVTLADVDQDNIVDYVYAGDLQGNVWRFDLSDKDESSWVKQPQLIFKTPNKQPITTQIAFSQDKKSGNRAILNFGTGHFQLGYLAAEDSYAKGQQALYGIWDEGVEQFPQSSTPGAKVDFNQLLKQEINFTTNEVSSNNICWASAGNGKCGSEMGHYGWYMNLENINRKNGIEYEQLTFTPKLYNGVIVFNTIANGDSAIASCSATSEANGYTYAVQAGSGKAAPSFFDNDGKREPLGGIGEPNLVYVDGQWYLISKDQQGGIEFIPVTLEDDPRTVLKRLSWKIITPKFEH